MLTSILEVFPLSPGPIDKADFIPSNIAVNSVDQIPDKLVFPFALNFLQRRQIEPMILEYETSVSNQRTITDGFYLGTTHAVHKPDGASTSKECSP